MDLSANYKNEIVTQVIAASNNLKKNMCDKNVQEQFLKSDALLSELLLCTQDSRNHIKTILSAVNSQHDQTQRKLLDKRKHNSDTFDEKILELETLRDSHEKRLRQSSHVLDEIINKKKCVLQEIQTTNVHEEKLHIKETDEIVRKQAAFALLVSTLNIRWDYQCSSTEVKGCISNKNEIVPFVIKKEQHSKGYTPNYLWDLLESLN